LFPDSLISFFQSHQDVLWIITLSLDLAFTVLMYRFFGRDGLLGCIILSILLANLQGPKLTTIFGLQTSLGVIFYSSIFFATDLLSEKYGRAMANRAVLIGFSVSCILVLMLSIALLFLPSIDPETAEFSNRIQKSFENILNFTPRFVFGSLLAYLISQSLDVWLFHWIRKKTAGRMLWLRNNGSTMISQAVDTLIYSLVVWWGVVELSTAIQLGLVKYGFKLAIAAIDTPFIYWAISWDHPAQEQPKQSQN